MLGSLISQSRTDELSRLDEEGDDDDDDEILAVNADGQVRKSFRTVFIFGRNYTLKLCTIMDKIFGFICTNNH
jgi:hypothetical protein